MNTQKLLLIQSIERKMLINIKQQSELKAQITKLEGQLAQMKLTLERLEKVQN